MMTLTWASEWTCQMMGVEMLYQATKKEIDSLDLQPGVMKMSLVSGEADVVHQIALFYTPDDVTRSGEDNGSVSC